MHKVCLTFALVLFITACNESPAPTSHKPPLTVPASEVTQNVKIDYKEQAFAAIESGDLQKLQEAIEHGVSPSLKNKHDCPLVYLAAKNGRLELMDYLFTFKNIETDCAAGSFEKKTIPFWILEGALQNLKLTYKKFGVIPNYDPAMSARELVERDAAVFSKFLAHGSDMDRTPDPFSLFEHAVDLDLLLMRFDIYSHFIDRMIANGWNQARHKNFISNHPNTNIASYSFFEKQQRLMMLAIKNLALALDIPALKWTDRQERQTDAVIQIMKYFLLFGYTFELGRYGNPLHEMIASLPREAFEKLYDAFRPLPLFYYDDEGRKNIINKLNLYSNHECSISYAFYEQNIHISDEECLSRILDNLEYLLLNKFIYSDDDSLMVMRRDFMNPEFDKDDWTSVWEYTLWAIRRLDKIQTRKLHFFVLMGMDTKDWYSNRHNSKDPEINALNKVIEQDEAFKELFEQPLKERKYRYLFLEYLKKYHEAYPRQVTE